MKQQLIECVPNFSEGRDMNIINSIRAAIESVEGIEILDVDPGAATNRTVVTFVGEPSAVVEAAYRGAVRGAELIDMRHHHGAHPRMGATDVLPLVPVSGITLEECAELARALANRLATEAGIPCYAYEAAALRPERKNLAVCRRGEYEALAERFATPDEAPDYGARPWDDAAARTGATAVGARDFLIAVNFNLNTTSTRRANAIAFDVREKGRPAREGGKLTGKPLAGPDGKPLMIPGTLKGTKAIGWYIDEYGIAQVSMNITDIAATPLHVAFDEVCRAAAARGIRVTGTEIVGVVPERVLLDAGRHFLHRQQRSTGIPDREIIRMAIKSMGLDELKPFDPAEKVIEYMIAARRPSVKSLVNFTCRAFAEETASESPAPGGGSVAAYLGALAGALGAMVANLSAHKAGWDERWREFSDVAERGNALMERLLHLVDADTEAFNRIMAALSMPKGTDAEKEARGAAMEAATLHAAQVPLVTAQTALETFEVLRYVAGHGNPASASDAGVGALCARAAVRGAALNVRINAAGLADTEAARRLIDDAAEAEAQAAEAETAVLDIVNAKISGR
ncbi:MAG: glutamate formimidoyltransferase [Muribaculaceae bacterium]|nr:glutamate formimidoyltransferase [Muribaculaceae bacterium]